MLRTAVASVCALALCVMGVPAAGLAIPGQALADALDGAQQQAAQATQPAQDGQQQDAQATTAAAKATGISVEVQYAVDGQADPTALTLKSSSDGLAKPDDLAVPTPNKAGIGSTTQGVQNVGVAWQIEYGAWEFKGWALKANATRPYGGLTAGKAVSDSAINYIKAQGTTDGTYSPVTLYPVWTPTSGTLSIGTAGGTGTLVTNGGANSKAQRAFWPWANKDHAQYITKVQVLGTVATGKSARYLFAGLKNVTEFDLTGLNTTASAAYDGSMNLMFAGCSKLQTLKTGANWRKVADAQLKEDRTQPDSTDIQRAVFPVRMAKAGAVYSAGSAVPSGAAEYKAVGDGYALTLDAAGGTISGKSSRLYMNIASATNADLRVLTDPFGTNPSAEQSLLTVLNATTPQAPAAGMSFDGWYFTDSYGRTLRAVVDNQLVKDAALAAADRTFTAHWSISGSAQIAADTYGGVAWNISAAGVLTLTPLSGVEGYAAGQLADSRYYSGELRIPATESADNSYTCYFPWTVYGPIVTDVVLAGAIKAPASAVGLFYNLSNVTKLDMTNLDTTATRDARSMFAGCSALAELVTGDTFALADAGYRATAPVTMVDRQASYGTLKAGANTYRAVGVGNQAFTVTTNGGVFAGGTSSKVYVIEKELYSDGSGLAYKAVAVKDPFGKNGGETSFAQILANIPTREGYSFDGWRWGYGMDGG